MPFEGPAALAHWASERGHVLRPVRLYADEPLAWAREMEALIALGGPMGVRDGQQYPWMQPEKLLIESCIEAGRPVFGVCLGAQLIADVLGAAVTRNAEPEIGWFPITPAADGPLREPLPVFHWHGDTFEIPADATPVARSDACRNQGFLYQGKVLALQCHLECTPQSVALLTEHCADELVDAPYVQSAERILAEPAATFQAMHAVLFDMLDALFA